jgi:hypothetical protein
MKSTLHLLSLASKTSFTEWYAKTSQAKTLNICLPCCVILACTKVEIRDYIFVNQMIPEWQTFKFVLLVKNQELIPLKQNSRPVLDSYL